MTTTTSTLNGFFKQRYGDKLERLQPSWSKIAQAIGFKERHRQGASYNFPVRLRRAMGATFNGGTTVGNAFTLNAVKSGLTQNAQVSGMEFVLREAVSYGAIKRGRSKMEAFGDAFDEVVTDMAESASFFREMTLLYGQADIGTVSSVSNSTVTTTFVVPLADWAPGLWVQMEGGYVDVWDAALSTKRNAANDAEVTNVNVSTRTITIVGDATEMGNVANTDRVFPKGAVVSSSVFNQFAGIDTITANTGTLFGIDAATYNLWQANTYPAGGAALTMAKINAAAALVTDRAGQRDLTAYVSTATWNNLNTSLDANRRYNEDVSNKIGAGTRMADGSITYYGPSGSVKICGHSMVKQGLAYLVDTRQWDRIGSTDLTFNLGVPGSEPNFFHELPDAAGVSLRCYWDQAIICRKPNTAVRITGIVNT